jgi:hypothetical protein
VLRPRTLCILCNSCSLNPIFEYVEMSAQI